MAATRSATIIRRLGSEAGHLRGNLPSSSACGPARWASSSTAAASSSSSLTSSQPMPGVTGSSSSSASLANTAASMTSKPGSAQEAAPQGSLESMSPLKQTVMKGIARVMGYNTRTATAIRATSDYYDRCSERDEKEATFFYDECGLPVSYQSWMQITNLHIWLLSVRYRSLPAPLGKSYIQEMINHYFIHAEGLMRGRYKVKQGRLIKGYLRDMLYQYHGANMGYDEGLISENDAVLAAAVWRNLFGAGWGKMGGVKGKLNQDKPPTEAELKAQEKEEASPLANLNLDPSLPPSPEIPNQMGGLHAGGTGLITPLPRHDPAGFVELQLKEARFALCLERLVKFIRSEVHRMENIPDEVVMRGVGAVQDRVSGDSAPGSLTAFGRI